MSNNTVYHYTSPDGILGILKDKTLRFTDCQYLNDKGEFVYIREPFKKAWKKIKEERGDSDDIIEQVINNFIRSPYELLSFQHVEKTSSRDIGIIFTHHRYYLLCASINADTANMWNYYVKNGLYQGYNLGINRNYINEWFSNYQNNHVEFIDGKVIYNENLQVKMIYEELKKLLTQYDEKEKTINDFQEQVILLDEFQGELYNYIHQQKIFFKNPAFSSEEEHRFVLKVGNDFTSDDDLSLNFRVGISGIITPFIEWKFKLDDKERLFKQITLAPMIESDLAEESFKRFLAATVQQNIKIKQSSINLRF